MERFTPRYDAVLVEESEIDKFTPSGLAIIVNEKPAILRGIIIEKGEDVYDLTAGDIIMYNKFSGQDISLNGNTYRLLKHVDILGKITERHD